MKRRDFLRSLTAGSLGLMLGNGLSIQRASPQGRSTRTVSLSLCTSQVLGMSCSGWTLGTPTSSPKSG